MIELVQLERRHQEFADRKVQLVAVSVDDLSETGKTQANVPHITVLSDPQQSLAKSAGAVHRGGGPSGQEVDAPTIFFIDRNGIVRDIFRSSSAAERLPTDEVLRRATQLQ